MTTPFNAIESAIRSRLATEWALLHPSIPVRYENTAHPETTPPFIYLSITFMGSNQVAIGSGASNRKYRHNGLIIVGIYTAANSGPGDASQYADEIANIFRGQTFSGVVCLAPVADRGRPADEKGNYWLKTLTCEFYSDSLH